MTAHNSQSLGFCKDTDVYIVIKTSNDLRYVCMLYNYVAPIITHKHIFLIAM